MVKGVPKKRTQNSKYQQHSIHNEVNKLNLLIDQAHEIPLEVQPLWKTAAIS